jgi:hypothetical protein
MSLIGPQTSLWWMRLLLVCVGIAMAQVIIPAQAAAFATISPEATGRASTMFNVMRQLGGAVGVAVFTTAIVAVGITKIVAGRAPLKRGSVRSSSSQRARSSISRSTAAVTVLVKGTSW